MPRRITLIPAVVERFTPLTPEFRMPPGNWRQSISIDLVMVTAPKPPGSRQLILPPAAVLEMAPANVLQGAVRLHGLASSPTPDTQVRVACACASELQVTKRMNAVNAWKISFFLFTTNLLQDLGFPFPSTLGRNQPQYARAWSPSRDLLRERPLATPSSLLV